MCKLVEFRIACFTALAISVLGSTAASQSGTHTDPEGSGKPIKTVETPWGPRELYDPSKDPEFIQAVSDIYAQGDVTYGDLSIHNSAHLHPHLPGDVAFVRDAILTQRLDMARAGCKGSYHYSYKPEPVEVGLARQCTDSQFGAPKLSYCEQENWRAIFSGTGLISLGIADADLHKYRISATAFRSGRGQDGKTVIWTTYWNEGRDHTKPIYPMAYIGTQSDHTLDETIDLLTVSECDGWYSDNWRKL